MHELTIIPPESYEVDKEKSTFEKIVFKPINFKPRSWKEYRAKVPENKLYRVWGVVEGEELAKALTAIMQLMSLRQAWIGDWKPDWNDYHSSKFCICGHKEDFVIYPYTMYNQPLSFPTKVMAQEFLDCFKDLIKQAKELI